MHDRSPAPQPPEIEFWFDFGSPYSFISLMRIQPVADRYGLTVRWKPFLLGPIFKSFGWDTSPFVLNPIQGAHMWIDVARQCRKYDVPWARPSSFPRRALLPTRVALLGSDEPWFHEFCRRIMQRNFVADSEVDAPEAVAAVLRELLLPADELIAAAQAESNKSRLHQRTREAQERGVFGAPTFFIGNEMFWGNDRLEDALAFALHTASGATAR